MRLLRLSLLVFFAALPGALPAHPPAELVGRDPFPAAMEFKEISAQQTEKSIDSAAELARLDKGAALVETGLKRYAERTYALAVPGTLVVGIMTFSDPRESYSALTFLAVKEIKPGPPGDFSESEGDTMLFAAGPCLVRIE